MADLSSDPWINTFRTYIGRYESPLSSFCPNSLPSTPLKGKSESPLVKALEVISSPIEQDNPKLVSLAFKVVYLKSKSHEEVLRTIKKHQRYVVEVSSKQLTATSRYELSTLGHVLIESKKFTTMSWEQLINLKINTLLFPTAVIMSFYFFVIQGILQHMSANLHALTKPQLDLKLIWDVLKVLSPDSEFTRILATSNAAVHEKYSKNRLKLLTGYRKVLSFIHSKSKSKESSDLLILIDSRVLELQLPSDHGILSCQTEQAPLKTVPVSNAFDGDVLITNSPKISKTHNMSFVGSKTILASLDHNNISASQESRVNEMLQKKNGHEFNHENQLLQRLRLNTVSLELVAEVLDFIEPFKMDKPVFQRILKAFGPNLVKVFKEVHHPDYQRQLSRLCFQFANTTSSDIGFEISAQLDLLIATETKNPADLKRIMKRIEFSIRKILNLNEYGTAKVLVQTYLSVVHDVLIDESFSRMAGESLAQNPDLVHIFFGTFLLLEINKQISLFDQVIPILARISPEDSHRIVKKVYEILKKRLPLTSVLKLTPHFTSVIDETSLNVAQESDNLLVAAIKTENLKQRNVSEKDAGEIQEHLIKWHQHIDAEHEPLDIARAKIFLRVLRGLYLMGFYNLSFNLSENFDISIIKMESEFCFNFALFHCQCAMKIDHRDIVPQSLKLAGEYLKDIATECKSFAFSMMIMQWKLLQLEYFYETHDRVKLEAKLKEIGLFMASKDEFQLNSSTSFDSSEQKLTSVLLLARYHLFVSKAKYDKSEFIKAIEHGKFSLKLAKSVLKNLDGSNDQIFCASKDLLMECLRTCFIHFKHVGLSKEALSMLNDLQNVTETFTPVQSSYSHFELVSALLYVGHKKSAFEHFKEGKELAVATGFKSLRVCQKIASELIEPEVNKLYEEVDSYVMGQKSCPHLLQALSANDVAKLYLSSQIFHNLEGLTKSNTVAQFALTDRHIMLKKTLSVLEYEMGSIQHTLKAKFLIQNTKIQKKNIGIPSSILDSITECKNCLLRMTEHDYYFCLDNSEQRKVSHLFRTCSIILSSVGTTCFELKDVDQLLYLEDTARNQPYEYQRTVWQQTNSIPTFDSPDYRKSEIENANGFLGLLQKNLPDNWSVVSLDVCSLSGDILVTKVMTKGSLPLVTNIKMPPGFDFKTLSDSIEDIIALSNHSTKASVTSLVKTKEDRKNWWRHRFDLDMRLKDILKKIESIFSGLNGLFSFVSCLDQRFLVFSNELNCIWKQIHPEIPSHWEFETNLCSLFFCLDPFDENGLFCAQTVKDLIEWVYGVLSENCIIENNLRKQSRIFESLKSLYTAPRKHPENEHLILVPSDICSSIPWESLNLLRGRSITRMTSFGGINNLLARYHDNMRVERLHRHLLAFVLNPGRDLKRTQSLFDPIFAGIKDAVGISGEPPTEQFLLDSIRQSDLYVFMGHGGGEQYVRLSSIMKDQNTAKLPPALLMGCSSCAFQSNGKLPATSNIFYWLAYGAPAVVANLWDVTDKDIDLFTMSMLEQWGVIADSSNLATTDLSKAVSVSRDRCILRYLNGAAPVVYGLPLRYNNGQK